MGQEFFPPDRVLEVYRGATLCFRVPLATAFAARREAPQVASATADDDDAREMIRCCRECSELLSAKELAFVRSMAKWRGEPTERQMAWLSSLYERCMKGEHA